MATQLSQATKNVKKYGIIFLAAMALITVLSWFAYNSGNLLPQPGKNTDENYPAADDLFGQIPRPELTSITIDPNSAAIISKKSSTKFPEEPSTAYIYQIDLEREHAKDSVLARETAQKINFNYNETKNISNVMYWETPEKNRYLQYDLAQRYWSYRYSTYPQGTTSSLLDTAAKYIPIAGDFMSTLGITTTDMENDAGRAEYIQLSSSGSISNIVSSPNAAKVALYKQVELIEPISSQETVITANVRKFTYTDGIANLIINGQGTTIISNLLQLNYKYHSYCTVEDKVLKGIYSLLSPEEAFIKLQSNGGYLYRIILDGQNEYGTAVTYNVKEYVIDASKTQIIYIEPDTVKADAPWTTYLQPYYLFEGSFTTKDGQNGSCAFLVPALTTESYK